MKKLSLLIIILLIINLPILIYLGNFKLITYDKNFYKNQFKENKVYDTISSADNLLDNILSFLKTNQPLNDEFTENEKSHMVDVKNLVFWSNILFYILLGLEIILLLSLPGVDILSKISLYKVLPSVS